MITYLYKPSSYLCIWLLKNNLNARDPVPILTDSANEVNISKFNKYVKWGTVAKRYSHKMFQNLVHLLPENQI